MDITHRILNLKKKINTKKQERDRLIAKEQLLSTDLKNNYGCDSIEEGRLKLRQLKLNAEKKEQTLLKRVEEVEKRYAD